MDNPIKKLAETIKHMYDQKPVEQLNEATMMKDTGEIVHNCAKHVEHAEWGRSEEHTSELQSH